MVDPSLYTKRRRFLEGAAAFSLPGVIGTTAATLAATPQTVRVISFPSDAATQILYPLQNDLFRKRGIDVNLTSMGSGAAIIAALLGGSADFGTTSLFAAFTAYGHNLPIRMVAPIAIYDSDHCDTWLVVRSDAPIHTGADLNGKVMASDAPSDIYVYTTRLWADRHGGNGSSIKAIALNAAQQLAALEQGRVDVCVLRPPFLTLAMRSATFRVIGKPFDVIAQKFLLSCWVATVDFINQNPDAVKAFVAGLLDGGRYANAHQADTVDMVAQFTKQDPQQLREGVRTTISNGITLGDVQAPLDFASKVGIIDKHYDAKAILSTYVPMAKPGRTV